MSLIELKTQLIQLVEQSNDVSLLTTIFETLKQNKETRSDSLTEQDWQDIDDSIAEIKRGEFLTYQEVKILLKERKSNGKKDNILP